MQRLLATNAAFANGLLTQMLSRIIRAEDNLVDQLFNSTKKRLARVLLLLARSQAADPRPRTVPRPSQELLADMIGTTRSRVNVFMNHFRQRGYIDYDGRNLMVNRSLFEVVLRD